MKHLYNIWNLLGRMYACFDLWPTKDILGEEYNGCKQSMLHGYPKNKKIKPMKA